MRATWVATTLLCAAPCWVAAQDISFGLPIDCTLGDTCYIQQFVDHDPGSDASDAFCGPNTYDGHKGTDFGLPTLKAMAAGVDVIASAPGVVAGLRDGMADQYYTDQNADAVRGRECGNGVVLDHGNGWQTQYCHLLKGSVTVQKGQTVETGDVLGQVGLSGRTQFPHVHLSVRKDGTVVDPFDPDGVITCEAPSAETLWDATIDLQFGGILDVGFAEAVPEYDDVKAGTASSDALPAESPALVVYAFAYSSRVGDVLRLSLEGPTELVITKEIDLDRTQAQFFRAIGKRLRGGGWERGEYTGTATLLRGDKVVGERVEMFRVE